MMRRVLRRAGRHLVTILTGLSLLLCVATCGLWVRSYRWADELEVTQAREWRFFSLQGRLNVYCQTVYEGDPRGSFALKPFARSTTIRYTAKKPEAFWYVYLNGEWFSYHYQRTAGLGVFGMRGMGEPVWEERPNQRYLTFPHWCLAGPCAFAPLSHVFRRLRWRVMAGRCSTCGYDLRATPDRCPECGATPAKTV